MDENFDCTQFITFNDNGDDVLKKMHYVFENSDFTILPKSKIQAVKLNYFSQDLCEYVFELVNDEFLGDFDDWKEIDCIPNSIQDFILEITKVVEFGAEDLKVILTNFAERGKTSDFHTCVKVSELKKALHYMSHSNYEVWTDNLIVKVESAR